MKLRIDGLEVVARQGETLLELMRRLHLDDQRLSCRPLVAKIAGEIFTLNYVPVRQQESNPDRPSIRRAMAASGGEIRLLRYGDAPGREAYIRTAQFVIFLAFHQLWPDAMVKMNCTVGSSVYLQVSDAPDFDVTRLKKQIAAIVEQDIPLMRRRVTLEEAIANYTAAGQLDKARLLKWRNFDFFDQYVHEDFADYYYGEMMPSTGYLQVWDIRAVEGGFLFVYPDPAAPDQVARYLESPNFFRGRTLGSTDGM